WLCDPVVPSRADSAAKVGATKGREVQMRRSEMLGIVAVVWCAYVTDATVARSADGYPAPAAAQAVTAGADDRDADGGTSAFYRYTGPTGSPGTMIRTEDISASKLPTEAARGMRMLYVATDGLGSGTPVVVSGQVLLPKAPMPAGGWPIVAWEHGTTGIADV